jgi:hypothetical protein
MTGTPAARADATNFATCGIDAMQRGRRSLSHACLLKSSSSSAVVVRSTVTAFNAGGAGAFTVAHSSMIDAAPAAFAMNIVAASADATRRRKCNSFRLLNEASTDVLADRRSRRRKGDRTVTAP